MNKDRNNELIPEKEKNGEKEDGKSEESIILQTNNSCLEEQSFFKPSNLNNKKETELSKLSRDIFSNIYKNKVQIDNNLQNYETFLDLQNFPKTSSKLKNKKIIKDFIQRNNYTKNDKNNNNEENSENDENNIENEAKEFNKNKNIVNNNDNHKTNYDNIIFQNFLDREKRFMVKINQEKKNLFSLEEDELLNKIQDRPRINKKSSKLALKKNKSTKIFQRLYKNPNILEFNVNNENKPIENNYIKESNINISESQKLNGKKYSFRKRSKKEIRSFSNNNFYKNENFEKEEIKVNNNNEVLQENQNQLRNKFKTPKKYKTNANFYYIGGPNAYKNKTIKKGKPYDKDELFNKYNSISAAEKMKIFQIKKINKTIDDLLFKDEQNITTCGINFFLFCELLFELGYVYILHKIQNNSELNDEYIKNVISQPYLNKSSITKEFIYNEISLINKAFSSIRNNFNLPKQIKFIKNENIKENLLPFDNNEIEIEDFKLFIFILSNNFEGYEFEKEKKENDPSRKSTNNISQINIKNNSSTHSNKTNISVKIKNNEKMKINKINNLISKLISNKNLVTFNYKDIMNYKNYFKYMIDINNKHIIFCNQEKKIIKKEKIKKDVLNPFTFTPKTNKNNDLILDAIKPNMNFEERNLLISQKKDKHKMELKNKINKELLEEVTFNPKLNKKESIKYFKKVNEMIEKEKIEKEKIEKEKKEKENKIINNINVIVPEIENKTENKENKKKKFRIFSSSKELEKKKIQNLRNLNFYKKLKYFEENNREILSLDVKKNNRLLNYLLNNADEGRMNMALEKKSNKDTFQVFENEKRQNDENGYISNVFDILNSKNNYPIFTVEIKIQNDSKSEALEIFANDDYEKVCQNFCKNHRLGEESYIQILEKVKRKIKEIDEYTLDNKKEK